MRTRIGTQLIVGAGCATALVIGVMTALSLRSHGAQLLRERTRCANQLGEVIQGSTYHDMLENRRDNLHRQIRTLGGLHAEGIHKVRLFNKEGRIMFSSQADEIGHEVDMKAEACHACHAAGRPLERLTMNARSRIFWGAEGERVLGIITPIPNQPTCSTAACHAHDGKQRILGVLDVNVSLGEMDREIRQGRILMLGLAALAVLASSLMLWWLNRRLVLTPVRALLDGTRRVAEGDLGREIPVSARHELGQLATAFNRMTHRLVDVQKQLTQADKLASVGRLAAGLAHEINNPLTGVLGYASLLKRRFASDAEAQSDLGVIVRETERCRAIIRDLLNFARPAPLSRRMVDVNEVVHHSVAVGLSLGEHPELKVTFELASGLPQVPADPNQVEQVLVNLLLNAQDALGGKGTITVRTGLRRQEPRGICVLRHATCKHGHDLMDLTLRVGGQPSVGIRMLRHGTTLPLHLDPVYGRSGAFVLEPVEGDAQADYLCPTCGESLVVREPGCPQCGAPQVVVLAGPQDPVSWCVGPGCHAMSWPSREAEGMLELVAVEVLDDGPGIPQENLPRLFEPFFSTKGNRGTGLGLSVSWAIAASHGGALQAHSEPGTGAHFTLLLPVRPLADSPSTEIQP